MLNRSINIRLPPVIGSPAIPEPTLWMVSWYTWSLCLRTIGVPLNAVVKIRASEWKMQTIFFKLLIISRKIFNILPIDTVSKGFGTWILIVLLLRFYVLCVMDRTYLAHFGYKEPRTRV